MWKSIDSIYIFVIASIAIAGGIIEGYLVLRYWQSTGKAAKAIALGRSYDSSALSKANARSPLHFIPTLLTALGILGTFTGIYLGLQGISLQSLNDTEALLGNSIELLSGMQVAFQSSLWGLGSASAFILTIAIAEGIRRFRRQSLIAKLNQNRRSDRTSNLLAEQLGKVADKLDGLAHLNGDRLAHEFAAALSPGFQDIRDELKNQRQAIEQQRQEVLETLVRKLHHEAISPLLIRLDESTTLTQEAATAVRDLKTELGGLARSLGNSIQTIQSFQEETLGQLQEFAQSLRQILDQFRSDTRGTMETISGDIRAAVEASIAIMKAQGDAFADNSDSASYAFREIREELEAALEMQARQQKNMLQKVQAATENTLERANDAFIEQSNALNSIGREASATIKRASDNLKSTLSQIDTTLQGTCETVDSQLSQFRENYHEGLIQFFDRQNQILETTLNQQRQGLEHVVEQLRQVLREDVRVMVREVQTTMSEIQETAKIVETLTDTTDSTSAQRLEQIQAIAQTLSCESQRVNEVYNGLIQHFDRGLQTWNRELAQYLEQAGETYKQSREDSERAAIRVCSQLDETTRSLIGVAEYLVAAANDLDK